MNRQLKGRQASIEESMGVRSVSEQPKKAIPAKNRNRRPMRDCSQIAIDFIKPDPDQPRTDFEEDKLNELAASIRSKGVITAIRVRWSEIENSWIIIAGERRWRAARIAGLTEIPCRVHESPLSESEILEEQIIENLQRRSLKPLEEARAFKALMRMNDWKQKQVAEALAVHPTQISRALSLLDLPAEIQSRIETNEISPRTGYELSKLDSHEQKLRLAQEVSNAGLTNEQTRNRVRIKKGKPVTNSMKLVFMTLEDHEVIIKAPKKSDYHVVKAALESVLDEVEGRIIGNVGI